MSSLLVTVDALRADHLGQYGYHRDTIPVVDALVDAGATRFDAAFANGTNTGISLPSLLSSRYRGDDAVADGPTVASPLSVTTGAVHSNTFFATKHDRAHGFDHFDDFDVSGEDGTAGDDQRLFRRAMDVLRPVVERLGVREAAEAVQEAVFPARFIHELTAYENAERTTDRALEWLDGVDGEFFLWVHYMDPHRPYGVDLDDPTYGPPADDEEIRDLMSLAGVAPDEVSDEQRERIVDLYDSDIRYTSRHVERLFDGLRSMGRWKDTDVVLTADHGEEFGEHGSYFHRNRPYDELMHVPLVVKSDRADGGVVEAQRELLDVAPTVCRFHDVDPPDAFLGQDLFEGDARRVVATGAFSEDSPVVAGRWDGRKYITAGDDEELYDLAADPGERENRAADEPDSCQQYRAELPSYLLESDAEGVPDEADVDEDVAERLAELGYME